MTFVDPDEGEAFADAKLLASEVFGCSGDSKSYVEDAIFVLRKRLCFEAKAALQESAEFEEQEDFTDARNESLFLFSDDEANDL